MTTASASATFTVTHARYLASKVAADLHQCRALYNRPDAEAVDAYNDELVTLLGGGYVDAYEFGFKNNGRRIVCWSYTVDGYGDLTGGDSRAGGLYARADVDGSTYYNYLTYSSNWYALDKAERDRIKDGLPVNRTSGSLPDDGSGYWVADHYYTSGGVRLSRRTFRPS